MEILKVIANIVGYTAKGLTEKSSNEKITKLGWIVIFLLELALFIFTLLNS
jgi:hypothetical protein